tara:strand:- start:352 stop:570 length:219 start_codon:yes stop_codon:yes gene_type:complete
VKNNELNLPTYTVKTPEVDANNKSPLSSEKRVDINELKSRIQDKQSKETRQNLIIFTCLLLAFSTLGIYLSI